jgi:hypothetical protein
MRRAAPEPVDHFPCGTFDLATIVHNRMATGLGLKLGLTDRPQDRRAPAARLAHGRATSRCRRLGNGSIVATIAAKR